MDEIKEINFNETGDIIDTLSGKSLKDTPEERVRQRFIGILQTDYGYPKANIAREVPVQQGSKILLSTDEAEIRADIVVYANKKACLERDQGNILFVVECKKPTVTEGYDVILMDVLMPKMNGHQAARAIRAMSKERPDAAKIPIIAQSANAFKEDVQASLDSGMNGHISKPFNIDAVTTAIKQNIKR